MNETHEDAARDVLKAWWLEQARSALISIGMGGAALEWLAYTHNAVFRVMHDGRTYSLRMANPGQAEIMQEEANILQVLDEAGLPVPKPVRVGHASDYSYLLMDYISGQSRTAESVSTYDMERIGAFLAQFHHISTTINKTMEFRKSLDWNGLFAPDGIYHPGDDNIRVFTARQLELMEIVTRQVKDAMDTLGRGSDAFGLIHGDLLLKNILFDGKDLYALDFEYCGRGYYLYDLTPILWQLKPQNRYAHLEAALWDGYTGTRPLNQDHRSLLETFVAARQVASMRWIAANQQNPHVAGKAQAILDQRANELADFLATGRLSRL